jgi:hypothetical protein
LLYIEKSNVTCNFVTNARNARKYDILWLQNGYKKEKKVDEKRIIYDLIADIWDLTKKYVFQTLDDNGWNKLIYEANKLSNKYKQTDEKTRMLFCDIYFAIEKYKVKRDKELSDN